MVQGQASNRRKKKDFKIIWKKKKKIAFKQFLKNISFAISNYAHFCPQKLFCQKILKLLLFKNEVKF